MHSLGTIRAMNERHHADHVDAKTLASLTDKQRATIRRGAEALAGALVILRTHGAPLPYGARDEWPAALAELRRLAILAEKPAP